MVSCPADNRRDCDTTTNGAATDVCPHEDVIPRGQICPHRSVEKNSGKRSVTPRPLNPIPSTSRIPPGCHERFLPLKLAALKPLRDSGVTLAGISDLCPPYEMGRPDPAHHVVICTLFGSATLVTPKRRRTLTAGSLWTGAAHGPHHYFVTDAWYMFWFHLDPGAPWVVPHDDESPVQPANRLASLPPAIEGCIGESMLDDPYARDIARAYAEVIARHLARALGGSGSPAERRVRHELQTLWQKVDADLQRAWSVEQLAAELRVSGVQCHRLVGRYHHTTPMGMVARLRMQRAEELLRHTDFPLYLVADTVGYQTPFSFSRAFKQHTGLSPRHFRQKIAPRRTDAPRIAGRNQGASRPRS
ncbi:MAG: hypothetical protein A3K19_25810 [Lentisphaerae bacterium RIFOXYB12_FULL_65_16]|nr:MAG: hypothetical protein A3K18_31810 [Lentisphaerae bacterium RIFOXYA12_64_32]OGV91388.1 MAG: hypothetical protein A3K19_25810 [Lentisphaerae bacterium RIFOXYB12_FULL_65_16]